VNEVGATVGVDEFEAEREHVACTAHNAGRAAELPAHLAINTSINMPV